MLLKAENASESARVCEVLGNGARPDTHTGREEEKQWSGMKVFPVCKTTIGKTKMAIASVQM